MNKTKAGRSTRWVPVIGVVLVLIGLAMFYFFTWRPVTEARAAAGWTPTPCVVIESRVAFQRGDDSTTYAPHIVYRYMVNGVEHTSDRYDVMRVYSSGREGKQRIVDRYPVGSQHTCLVDPSNPANAVLVSDVPAETAIGGLGAIFVGLGLLVILYFRPKPTGAVVGPMPLWAFDRRGSASSTLARQPLQLRGSARGPAAIAITLFAVVWNGVLAFIAIVFFSIGQLPWFLLVALAPFALVGLWLLIAAVRGVLRLLAPRATLGIDHHPLRPGDFFELTWRFTGSGANLRKLTLRLIGKSYAWDFAEEGGGQRHFKADILADELLFESDQLADIVSGHCSGQIPEQAPPSHTRAGRGEPIIFWSIELHGEAAGGLDVRESFAIEVVAAQVNV